MSDLDKPDSAPEAPASLGERLRSFATPAAADGRRQESRAVFDYEQAQLGQGDISFPLARRGYERGAVDRRMAELERELAALRAHAARSEFEVIGAQTSAILTAAHAQAQQMTREAQEQAERCRADAAADAAEITQGAERHLRKLDADTDAVWRERERLIEDARLIAEELSALVQDAVKRFPAEDRPAPPSEDAPTASFRALPERADAAGEAQQADAAGEAQQADAAGEAQRADAAGEAQQADAAGEAQRADAAGEAQQADAAGEAQQADAAGEKR